MSDFISRTECRGTQTEIHIDACLCSVCLYLIAPNHDHIAVLPRDRMAHGSFVLASFFASLCAAEQNQDPSCRQGGVIVKVADS